MDRETESTEYITARARRVFGLKPGDRLGRYEIEGPLGAGGGGQVYRATDPTLRRPVAIKVLTTSISADEISRRRFAREAETASALNHPNIVTIYEIGVENAVDYIAMEFISGKSLRDNLPADGLDLPHFLPWAIQIADALAAAHDAGVVHRDLKPSNIMITSRGLAKVVDFGLAKPVRTHEDSTAADTLTGHGAVMGTCAYMAPEQAEGKDVDARADIFSFGCVMYEMLTGRAAFSGTSQMSTIASVLQKEPEPIRDVKPSIPVSIERIVTQCLRKSPEARWQSAADIRTLLIYAQQDWNTPTQDRAQRKRPRWGVAAAFATGLAIAAAGAYWLQRRNAVAPPEYRTIALTTDSGLSTSPSLSADGRLLTYASDRSGDGNLDIWIQQIGGRAPVRLTQDPADESDPDISADGTRIAFRSEKEGGGIYVMPALGGEPLLLAQSGRNPRFSPDGKSIVYWAGREGPAVTAGSAGVYVISAEGGQPVKLGTDLAAALYPVWSPRGDAVLALARKNPDHRVERMPDWWVIPLSGASRNTEAIKLFRSAATRILAPLTQFHVQPLLWSTENGGTVFFSGRNGETVNVWAAVLDPRNPRVTRPPSQVTTGTGSELHAALATSAGVSRMAFTNMTLQFDLWAIPADIEHASTTGEARRLTDDLSWEFFPSLPYDGVRAVYSSRRGPISWLCMRDVVSGKETTLLTSPTDIRSPRISGDGKWVFYRAGNILSRVATRGGATAELCSECGSPTGVSADGSISVIETDSTEDVNVVDGATGKVSTLVPARGPLFGGQLSPDGKWVVFHERKSNTSTQIFLSRVIDNKAAPPEQWIPITGVDAANQGPQWSPEGNAIYFRSDRDGWRCVWAQRVDAATKKPAGPAVAIQHFHHARKSLQHLRSFDDRTRIAVAKDVVLVTVGELRGNVWLREQNTAQ